MSLFQSGVDCFFFPEEWTYGCRGFTVDFATLSRRPFIVPKRLRVDMTFYFRIFLLHRFHTTSLSQLPHKCCWKRLATIAGYSPSFWDSQLDDSVMGTVALSHLSSYVDHFLPCDERLCGTIVWVIWSNQVDVHSRNCVFSNEHYTASACTKMRVWHVGGSHSHKSEIQASFRVHYVGGRGNAHW